MALDVCVLNPVDKVCGEVGVPYFETDFWDAEENGKYIWYVGVQITTYLLQHVIHI